jgi:lysophospholipase
VQLLELIAIPGNAIPDGLKVIPIKTRDGTLLRAAALQAPASRGTIALIGGRGDFIERYFETIRDLVSRNFSVATFDFRGQGGSQRPYRNPYRGKLGDFAEYDDDFDAFMNQLVLPDMPPPYYALAHSTGGAVILRALKKRTWFDKAVLTSPLLGVHTAPWPMPAVRMLATLVPMFGLGGMFLPGHLDKPLSLKGFPNNPFSSDIHRFTRDTAILAASPELGLGGPSFSWLKAAIRAMDGLQRNTGAEKLRTPVLIVAAGQDRIVDTEAVRRFAHNLAGISLVVIPESRHEILAERSEIREQFFAAFDTFMEIQTPSKAWL